MIKRESYKGFKITYSKTSAGFNQWQVKIQKTRFTGTRRQEYYLKYLNTYQSKLSEAKKESKLFINNLQRISWKSSGLSNATYLPK